MPVPDDRAVALCRILLRLQLRRLREAAGLKASAVAKMYGWSTARMTRLETKDNAVEVGDVRLLCDLYGASAELREELEGYALVTKTRKDWYETAPFKGTVPSWFSAYLGLESAAKWIRIYQAEFVPGLVQDPEYARTILGLSDASESTIGLHAEVRLKRQSILTRENDAPNVSIVLNEAVIRRPVGDTMKKQLEVIAALAERPNINVQVLPFSVGAHPAMHGPFTILGFVDETLGDLAYLENRVDGGVLADPELVTPFIETFGTLERLAATPQDSLAMIKEAATAL
ncbi:helix-turn-helix transcriptional regulator [Streptomyces sp. NPDC005538]|uniref:helix-turn-helix domain-containing protein n=1 Tax=Streptomyces sp. NPDC005538 TaxID=3157043 RepID=UPI0033A021FA